MIQHLTADQLGDIAYRGGSLVVDGMRYTAAQLGDIAYRLQGGATLHIANSKHFTAAQMGDIAYRKQGQVIFS